MMLRRIAAIVVAGTLMMVPSAGAAPRTVRTR